jgi:hypothetical protein
MKMRRQKVTVLALVALAALVSLALLRGEPRAHAQDQALPLADVAVNPTPNAPKPNSGSVAPPSSSIWTPVGKGIFSFNFGDSKGSRHQCGRLIQSAWRFDNSQKQNVLLK